MTYSKPAPAARRSRATIPVVLVIGAMALVGALVYQSMDSSSSSAAPFVNSFRSESPGVLAEVPGGVLRGALGEAGGEVPDGVTVFNDEIPAVAKLDSHLHEALRRAAADSADDGVLLFVDSGWRSPEYQEQLLQEAISKYGSKKEAARWVATPNTSAHVSGDAVDIGPSKAAVWLSKHGTKYGLCQVYRNEPWHYELRPEAIGRHCPAMYADPTHDPRMKQ